MKKRITIGKRLLTMLLAVLLTAGLLAGVSPAPVQAQEAAASSYVVLSVEKFAIGRGWITEPDIVPVTEGETVAQVLQDYLPAKGYPLEIKETASYGAYLSGIQNADPDGTLVLPESTRKMAAKAGITIPSDLANKDAPHLREFSYGNDAAGTNTSGWIYSVNNTIPGVGIGYYKVSSGDVVRLQFTLYGTGEDISGEVYGGTPDYVRADKSALLTRLAYINQNPSQWLDTEAKQSAYQAACAVAQQLDATQSQVDAALKALPERAMVWPELVTLSASELTLYINGESEKLTATVSPENADFSELTWESSDSSIATVDQKGNVTPDGRGDVQISAKTQSGLAGQCTVHVVDRPYQSITMNTTSVFLEADQTAQLSVTGSPANATEALCLTWSSDRESVAKVDQNGLVTSVAKGTAKITAVQQGSGIQAACTVTVGDAKEVAEQVQAQIEALPKAGDLKISDADAVHAAQTAWDSLSDTARGYLKDADALERRLKRCAEQMAQLEKTYAGVLAVEAQIEALPSLSALTLADQTAVDAAQAAYQALSTTEKGLMDASLLRKLTQASGRIEELQKQLATAQQALAGVDPDGGLSQAAAVAAAAEAYQNLDDGQKSQLDGALIQRLNTALANLTAQVEAAVNALDTGAAFYLQAQTVQDYLAAENALNLCGGLLTVSDSVRQKRPAAQAYIAGGISTSGKVTQSGSDWYLKLEASRLSSLTAVSKAVRKKDATADDAAAAWKISWKDLRSGSEAVPDQPETLTFSVGGLSDLSDPALYLVLDASSGAGKTTVKKLQAQFNAAAGIVTVRTDVPGTYAVAGHVVPLTGLTLQTTASLLKGESLQLTPRLVPTETTERPSYVWSSSSEDVATVSSSGVVKGVKKGTATITVRVKGDSSLYASCKVTVRTGANALSKSVGTILKETDAYVQSVDTRPTVGSEWYVLASARYGRNLSDSYFSTYYNHLVNYLKEKNGVLSDTKMSEYSKTILVLTAIGKDAQNVAGYNLLQNLADFDKVKSQGLNGPIWALIALKSNAAYSIPKVSGVGTQTTEDVLVQYLLDRQLSDGGWALSGTSADTDITAMTLQALAPYYQKEGREKVTAAIDRALDRLGKMQLSDGGYGTMGVETSESVAQVLTALTALGIDPKTDTRFIKGGSWTVENMISYHIDNSGFMHVKPGAANNGGAAAGSVDGLATGQGFYSLVAYQRMLDGKASLYDMSDVTLTAGGQGDGKGTGLENTKTGTSGTGSSSGKTAGGINTSSGSGSSGGSSGGSGSGARVYSGTAAASGAAGKTAGKTAAGSTGAAKPAESVSSDNSGNSGWQFTGKDMDLTGDEDGEASAEMAVGSTSGDPGKSAAASGNGAEQGVNSHAGAFLPYIICILAGAAVLGVCLYLAYRKKSRP